MRTIKLTTNGRANEPTYEKRKNEQAYEWPNDKRTKELASERTNARTQERAISV